MSSFYERYLAPGDVRARQQLQSATTASALDASSSASTSVTPPNLRPAARADWASRQRRKDALLYGGVVFTFLSLFVTRRSLIRRRKTDYPATFTAQTPENRPKVNGGLEAAEALGLATLNVTSLAMLTAGGFATYFDVADIEDMREGVRRGIGYDVYGGNPEEDKEMEDWVKDLLTKRDEGENVDIRGRIGEKLQELADMEKKKAEEAKRNEAK
ncbi:hypothetical protein D0862_00095 [Hortaea werneckii]|uniref:Altered inheritance of mitochondria protein 11 n=1 Tax=Hortaea werneckii TaxID=91943 RepID=A0A3M7HZG0_HORWE|nr:hypothetical protein D0862_00095 [Hortaea werneckii]